MICYFYPVSGSVPPPTHPLWWARQGNYWMTDTSTTSSTTRSTTRSTKRSTPSSTDNEDYNEAPTEEKLPKILWLHHHLSSLSPFMADTFEQLLLDHQIIIPSLTYRHHIIIISPLYHHHLIIISSSYHHPILII